MINSYTKPHYPPRLNTRVNFFMKKKAIILDLDNTIYAVRTIGDELFAPLFDLISKDGNHAKDLDKIKSETMRRPFQWVAKKYHFSDELAAKGTDILKTLAYNGKIEPFEDYSYVRSLPVDRFLVTMGFLKMQQSKVEKMNIARDFKEIFIVDPSVSEKTKKDVFEEIVHKYGYAKSDTLIVGDDPESEIKAARELNIDAVLYDKDNLYPDADVPRITNFTKLINYL